MNNHLTQMSPRRALSAAAALFFISAHAAAAPSRSPTIDSPSPGLGTLRAPQSQAIWRDVSAMSPSPGTGTLGIGAPVGTFAELASRSGWPEPSFGDAAWNGATGTGLMTLTAQYVAVPSVPSVPEPATWMLAVVGIGVLWPARRRAARRLR